MKFPSLSIAVFLLCCCNGVQAQTTSPYDENGKVKSVETRKYEEGKNNKTVPINTPAAAKKTTTNNAPATNTNGINSAAAIEAQKQKKLQEAQAKAAFIKSLAKYDEVDTAAFKMEGSYIRVKLAGKYGFVNDMAQEVIPLIYDDAVKYYTSGGFKVRIGNKWGFIDQYGKATVAIKYDELKDFVNSFNISTKNMKYISFAKLDGKYGYVGTLGEAIIPAIYDELEVEPSCGLYAARLNGKWGFLDNEGAVKIPFQFNTLVKKFTFPNNKTAENSENGYFKNTSARATVVKDNARFDIDTGGAVDGPKTDILTGKTVVEALKTGSFTDTRNNKTYSTIQIGSQVWMAENLDVAQFANGDPIPDADTDKEWLKADKKKKPASCYYGNDLANSKTGKLYNFYAVADPRGLAPAGWHIPTEAEWRTLIEGPTPWKELMHPNWLSSSAKSGFNALPGGLRSVFTNGTAGFILNNYTGMWWSSNINTTKYVFYYVISAQDKKEQWTEQMGMGLSVRCIKDSN